MRGKHLIVALALLTLLCIGSAAHAVEVDGMQSAPVALPSDTDMTYSGLLDPVTGLPAPGATEESLSQAGIPGLSGGQQSNTVQLSETCSYDLSTRQFVDFFPGDYSQYFFSSIPNGMVCNEQVSFEMPDGKSWTLYRNGDLLPNTSLSDIAQVGSYVLEVNSASGVGSTSFSFQITQGPTSVFSAYTPPEGLTLLSATLDGEPLTVTPGSPVSLEVDGTYAFEVSCQAAGLIYPVRIESDRTPPVLALEGVVDGEASHAVSLEDAEPGSTLDVTLDGAAYEVSFTKLLTQVGKYQVTITDAAGNSASYQFAIKLYFTVSALSALLLLVAAVAAVLLYSRHARKHLRVR